MSRPDVYDWIEAGHSSASLSFPTNKPALIERMPGCPLPEAADELLGTMLSSLPVTFVLQDAALRYVYAANPHPTFADKPTAGMDMPTQAEIEEKHRLLTEMKRRVMATGQPESKENWFRGTDGNDFFARVDYYPFPFPDGTRGVMGRLTDLSSGPLTNTQAAELQLALEGKTEELNEYKRKLDIALGVSKDFYFVQDENLRYVWAHNSFDGLSAEQILGKSDFDLGLPDGQGEHIYQINKQVLDEKQSSVKDTWVTLRDGTKRYYRFVLHPYKLRNGKLGVVGKALDLTNYKITEVALETANEKLTELNEELSRIAEELAAQNKQADWEAAQARKLQRSMLPLDLLLPGQFEICASMETRLPVGGDYYDYLNIGNDGLALTIGDATTHGLRAGMIVSAVRSYFQICADKYEPAALLSLISLGIERMQTDDIFMGMVVFRYDGKTFKLGFGGMPPVLWYRAANDRIEIVQMESIYLGSKLMRIFPEMELAIKPGDMLILMSDGFSECRNEMHDFLPADKVRAAALQGARIGCKEVIRLMQDLQAEWTVNCHLADDSTIVAVRFNGDLPVLP